MLVRTAVVLGVSFAGPALAQEAGAEAIGTGLGLIIGLGLTIVVGAIIGWLASLIVKGHGSGFWTDVMAGIGGSILAGFFLPAIGIPLGGGVIGPLFASVVGAVALLLLVRRIRQK